MIIVEPKAEIITMRNREEILKNIEKVGRVAYKSEDKITDESASKFVSMLVKRGHWAVLEHENITVKFTTNRGCGHEIVRHRVASYCQESTRYCVAGDTIPTYKNHRWNYSIKELYEKTLNGNGSWKRIFIRNLNENTGELIYSKIKNIFYNGVQPIYTIKTKLGYSLKCTGEHKIYTPEGYKQLNELSIGDNIYVNGVELSTDALYKNRDWLYYQNITLNKSFKQIADEFEYSVSVVKKWAYRLGIPKKGTGYYNVGRIPWNKGLSENDDIRVKNQSDALRQYHYDSSKRGQRIFKDDTSRYYKHNKGYCELCNTKENLEVHHIDKNHSNNVPENLITVCKSCHQYLHSQKLPFIHPDEVISIEYNGEQDVYDLEIDKFHNYVANGIVVHNCNYGKQNQIAICRPSYLKDELTEGEYYFDFDPNEVYKKTENGMWKKVDCSDIALCQIMAWQSCEDAYLEMLRLGCTPQQARGVLPNDTKTEIVMTANLREWKHFLDLRSKGTTGAPHPDMKEIADLLNEQLVAALPEVFGE